MTEVVEVNEEYVAPPTEVTEEFKAASEAMNMLAKMPIEDPVPATESVAEVPAPEAGASEADSIIEKLFARISPPEDVTYRKLFLYGPPGCGKTVFSATAPRPLIVRVEPTGTTSLLNHPELNGKVQTFQFISMAQLEILLNKMIEKPEAFSMFDTLVIDSISELQRINLDGIIAREAANNSDRNKYMRTWPDYNESTIHMAQFAGLLCKVPMNVIATCHRKEKEDKGKGISITQPSITDVLAEACAGFFDVMAYMSVSDEGTRSLQIAPTRTVVAKTRVGNLPAIVEEPTWDKLFGHLPGAK